MILLILNLIFASNPIMADSVVIGKVIGNSHCPDELSQVWFTTPDNTLLYQLEVPIGGSFELHSLPGTYSLVVNTKSGCLIEKKLNLVEGKRVNAELAIREPNRKLSTKPKKKASS